MVQKVQSRRGVTVLRNVVYAGFIGLFPVAVWNALGHFVLSDSVNEELLRFCCGQTTVDQGVRLRAEAYWSYWLHLAPSFFWVAAAPLQFSNALRRRAPTLHRWSGRVFAVCGLIVATTGASLAWIAPMQRVNSWTESVAATIGWSISVFALGAAVRAARARRFADHRRWMIRHVANGYIIVLIHVMSLPWTAVTDRTLSTEFTSVIVTSFLIITVVTEWWLYLEKARTKAKNAVAATRPPKALADAAL